METIIAHMYDGDMLWMGEGMWLWGPLLLVTWIAVLGGLAWLLVTRLGTDDARRSDAYRDAKRILAERYAKGDISTEEYQERLSAMR